MGSKSKKKKKNFHGTRPKLTLAASKKCYPTSACPVLLFGFRSDFLPDAPHSRDEKKYLAYDVPAYAATVRACQKINEKLIWNAAQPVPVWCAMTVAAAAKKLPLLPTHSDDNVPIL